MLNVMNHPITSVINPCVMNMKSFTFTLVCPSDNKPVSVINPGEKDLYAYDDSFYIKCPRCGQSHHVNIFWRM